MAQLKLSPSESHLLRSNDPGRPSPLVIRTEAEWRELLSSRSSNAARKESSSFDSALRAPLRMTLVLLEHYEVVRASCSMSKKAFNKIMRGLKEARVYIEGERQDYKVTAPPTVEAKEPPENAGCHVSILRRGMAAVLKRP